MLSSIAGNYLTYIDVLKIYALLEYNGESFVSLIFQFSEKGIFEFISHQ